MWGAPADPREEVGGETVDVNEDGATLSRCCRGDLVAASLCAAGGRDAAGGDQRGRSHAGAADGGVRQRGPPHLAVR